MTQRQSKKSVFKVKRHISEDGGPVQEIMFIIKNSNEVIISSFMGSGKTTLAEKHIYKAARKAGAVLIIVIPGVGQLIQTQKRGITIVCDGAGCTGEEDLYATTPDSLHKVITALKEKNKKIWLVVDECHNLVTEIGFRNKFKEIIKYKDDCEKTIYLTATPEPLLGIPFDNEIKIISDNRPVVPLIIQRCKDITPDTLLAIANSKYTPGEALLIANNNIRANEIIVDNLKQLIKEDKETIILDQNFQENLLGIKPQEKIVDKTEKAAAISAKTKTSVEASKILSEDPDEINKVAVFVFTSFIKAGLNIPNTKPTTLIFTVDDSTTITDIEQTIGRLRKLENIKEVILLVKEQAKAPVVETYKSMINQAMEVAREYLNVIQKAYRKGIDKTVAISMTKGTAIAYDEQADDFYIDELVLRNQIYLAFNAQVMKNNNVLKKLLQESSAINLNVTISEDVFTVNSNEIVKQQAELKKQREELAKRVLLDIDQIADKKTLQEVLTNTCNRSHPEMAEYVELAEKYQELVPKSFKADLKEIMARENIDAYEAYKIARESATKKKKEYKEKDAQEAVIEVNKLIKAEGIKYCIDLFEPFNIYRSTEYNEIFPRVTLIRTELEGEEGFKRTRLSQKKMNALAQILVEKRYYGIKPPPKLGSKTLRKQVENKIQKEREKAEKKNQRLISSGKKTLKIKVVDVDKFEIEYLQKLHKKNLDKALEQLYQDIKKIYNFTEDTKTLMISSIKFKTSKTLN